MSGLDVALPHSTVSSRFVFKGEHVPGSRAFSLLCFGLPHKIPPIYTNIYASNMWQNWGLEVRSWRCASHLPMITVAHALFLEKTEKEWDSCDTELWNKIWSTVWRVEKHAADDRHRKEPTRRCSSRCKSPTTPVGQRVAVMMKTRQTRTAEHVYCWAHTKTLCWAEVA